MISSRCLFGAVFGQIVNHFHQVISFTACVHRGSHHLRSKVTHLSKVTTLPPCLSRIWLGLRKGSGISKIRPHRTDRIGLSLHSICDAAERLALLRGAEVGVFVWQTITTADGLAEALGLGVQFQHK